MAKRILVALGESESAMKSVDYVAELVSGCEHFTIHLVHAVQPLPPQLLESRGAEDPSQEQRIEQNQAQEQNRWRERQGQEHVAPLFNTAKSRLAVAQVPENTIKTHIRELNDRNDLVTELVKAAHEYHCQTVVIGYTDYPWFKQHFHSHIGEQLIQNAEGLAICVVK